MHIKIGNVPAPKELIDLSFRRATAAASRERGLAKQRKRTRLQKSVQTEIARINAVQETVEKQLSILLERFPKFEELACFYQDLMLCTLDVDEFRKSLGAMGWAISQTRKICSQAKAKIRKTRMLEPIVKHRQECYGRVSSVIKQIRKNLEVLEKARKTIRQFPSVRTEMPTVVIAGFPNVGKTTILKALTGAKPEIAAYPFTTKKLMIGYYDSVQIIDTPGLLDRPLRKRNAIEKQAVLALKHLANMILFVIDPSETCGYTLKEQKNLLQETKSTFGVPFKVLLNKTDLVDAKTAEKTREELNAFMLAANREKGISTLKELLDSKLRKNIKTKK